jgi:hypothetical protein
MDWRRLRPADDIESDRLVGVATKASNLKISVAGIQRVTERRGRLRWPLIAEHSHVPGFAGELVSSLARLLGALGRCPN